MDPELEDFYVRYRVYHDEAKVIEPATCKDVLCVDENVAIQQVKSEFPLSQISVDKHGLWIPLDNIPQGKLKKGDALKVLRSKYYMVSCNLDLVMIVVAFPTFLNCRAISLKSTDHESPALFIQLLGIDTRLDLKMRIQSVQDGDFMPSLPSLLGCCSSRDPLCAGKEGTWKHPLKDPADFTFEDAYSRVVRIIGVNDNGEQETWGTGAYVQDRLVATARHVVVTDEGRFPECTVKGHRLTFIIASPMDDLAILEVPDGAAGVPFQLAAAAEIQVGKDVALLGFPLVVDHELGVEQVPSVGQDRIVAMDADGRRAASGCPNAFPNASGGAVILTSKRMAGVHIVSIHHEDTTFMDEQPDHDPPPGYETDVEHLWASSQPAERSSETTAEGSNGTAAERSSETVAAKIAQHIKHLQAYIGHKGDIGVFVTSQQIQQLLQAAKRMPMQPLGKGKVHARFKRPRRS